MLLLQASRPFILTFFYVQGVYHLPELFLNMSRGIPTYLYLRSQCAKAKLESASVSWKHRSKTYWMHNKAPKTTHPTNNESLWSQDQGAGRFGVWFKDDALSSCGRRDRVALWSLSLSLSFLIRNTASVTIAETFSSWLLWMTQKFWWD